MNRRIVFFKRIELKPWLHYDMVPSQEIKESEVPGGEFDTIIKAVRDAGFSYTLFRDEVYIEDSNLTSQRGKL